jgi:hypothetical protein
MEGVFRVDYPFFSPILLVACYQALRSSSVIFEIFPSFLPFLLIFVTAFSIVNVVHIRDHFAVWALVGISFSAHRIEVSQGRERVSLNFKVAAMSGLTSLSEALVSLAIASIFLFLIFFN